MYKYTGKHIKQIRVNDQNVEKKGKQLGLINYQDFDKSQGSFFHFYPIYPKLFC